MWEIEQIPDDALLYYRIHKGYVIEGEVIPGAFKERGEGEHKGMSTDWNKYSTAKEALNRSKNPADNGIARFNVGEVRNIKDVLVEHAPEPNNRVHSHIKGIPPKNPMKTRIRRKLLEACTWEIKPENLPSFVGTRALCYVSAKITSSNNTFYTSSRYRRGKAHFYLLFHFFVLVLQYTCLKSV